jgi:hypothetical protein
MIRATKTRFAPDRVAPIRGRTLGAALALLAGVAAALPSAAAADPPTRVTIVAVFEPISFGDNDYVNGQLIGTAQGGQLVALEQSPPPFTQWTPVGQVAADAAGYYSFKLQPTQTMRYRTSSQGIASDASVKIDVAPRLSFRATRAGSGSIRFSGTFAPARPGQMVTIQRRSSSGAWVQVARARLRAGKTFRGRLTATQPVTLRAFFRPDGAFSAATTRSVRLAP